VNWRERLETAIARAHCAAPDPLRCAECGCDLVVVEYRAALSWWIPVSCHYAARADGACPVLAGGIATWEAHEKLWEVLEAYFPVADYGEEADVLVAPR
jgi:hypothetical protein